MTATPSAIPDKHLARNIPYDFNGCCDRIRMRYFAARMYDENSQYGRVYRSLFPHLSDEELPYEDQVRIGVQIDEIQIRFLAIQKTIDRSVPAKPVHDTLERLQRSLAQALGALHDPDRDEIADELSVEPSIDGIRYLGDKLEEAQNLAEKVTLINRHLQEVSADLAPVVDFFLYKRGLVGRGNPPRYAMIYAVHALADLFETENTTGKKATVNEFAAGGRNEQTPTRPNARRYTGTFLSFADQFFYDLVPEQARSHTPSGFPDQLRKMAKNRTKDAELYRLLHKETVEVEDTLEFMTRADRLK